MSATTHWDMMVPQDYIISLEELIIGKNDITITIIMYIPAENVNR